MTWGHGALAGSKTSQGRLLGQSLEDGFKGAAGGFMFFFRSAEQENLDWTRRVVFCLCRISFKARSTSSMCRG